VSENAATSGANIRPWTSSELATVRAQAHLGAARVADLLDRSVASVRSAAYRQRISLRRKGSRRGSVMGQPRGVSLPAELRRGLLRTRVAEAVAARVALDEEAALCPACAARPIRVASTGLCRVCHLRRLAEAHREQLAEVEARRALWSARQDLKRARDRLPAGTRGGDDGLG
jgi:hypothetical protein